MKTQSKKFPLAHAGVLSSSALAIALVGLSFIVPTPARSQSSPPVGVVSSVKNPLQIAILHWYDANQGAVLDLTSLGIRPQNILCFDGSSIWVASAGTSNVTKIRASDGAALGTYPTSALAAAAVFDGFNIWIADFGAGGVSKIRASDGVLLGKFGQGFQQSSALAYDGANIWVANPVYGTVSKLRSSDGSLLGTFAVGQWPNGLAYDGSNLWVTVQNDNVVKKLRTSDGAILGTYFLTTAQLPTALAVDGAYIWVAGHYGAVARLRATDGALIGTYSVGFAPNSVVFDGANIWVASQGTSSVVKLRDFDGANLGSFGLSSGPESMAFDGANIARLGDAVSGRINPASSLVRSSSAVKLLLTSEIQRRHNYDPRRSL